MVKSANDYKKELEKNSVIAFTPKGNSMWPTLKGEKQAVIVAKKEKRLSYFDVALYVREDGTNVLHRVVEVKNDGYVMRGDSQELLEFVKEEQVLGVMTGFYKGKAYIDATDLKYLKSVEKWYRRKRVRRLKIKLMYVCKRLRGLFR